MKRTSLCIALSLVGSALAAGCEDNVSTYNKVSPAKIEQVGDTKTKRITLTPEAIKRIDLKTMVVRETQVLGHGGTSPVVKKVVPYGSLIYDEYGNTWVYALGQEHSFQRKAVKVDYIDGDDAVLIDGPPIETLIATSGAAELYGVEGGIGGGKK
jgi:hypothetical protein